MLMQIPFFIAFYWVLLESVEMRQAPFMRGSTTCRSRDPYFILPLIMGGAMFAAVQAEPDAARPDAGEDHAMIMPLVMSATIALFPSGLVLYWFTNTMLSILQQWHINQLVQGGNNKPRS